MSQIKVYIDLDPNIVKILKSLKKAGETKKIQSMFTIDDYIFNRKLEVSGWPDARELRKTHDINIPEYVDFYSPVMIGSLVRPWFSEGWIRKLFYENLIISYHLSKEEISRKNESLAYVLYRGPLDVRQKRGIKDIELLYDQEVKNLKGEERDAWVKERKDSLNGNKPLPFPDYLVYNYFRSAEPLWEFTRSKTYDVLNSDRKKLAEYDVVINLKEFELSRIGFE